jgi:predicted N-acetyltransferase YhbS
MNIGPFTFRLEEPGDDSEIETLHRDVFGPGRFARAAYRLREGVPHEADLSFVALAGERLVASVRLTRIAIGGRPALLLGPLVVRPEFKGQGAGKALVRVALEAARDAGHGVVMLVGDEPYYGPLGFIALPPYAITLPAPVDPKRVLVAGLRDGALDGLSGAATQADRKNS